MSAMHYFATRAFVAQIKNTKKEDTKPVVSKSTLPTFPEIAMSVCVLSLLFAYAVNLQYRYDAKPFSRYSLVPLGIVLFATALYKIVEPEDAAHSREDVYKITYLHKK